MASFPDSYTQIGNVRTRYWQAGERGSAVLLLHGIGCSVLEWERNVAALAEQHRVFAIDLLGFGLTDKPAGEPYGIARLARFALDFMAAQGIARAHLAGNSLGGSIALECARIAPEAVASLLLVDPAGVDRHGALLEFRLATLPWLGELLTRPNALGTRMLWRKAVAEPNGIVTEAMVHTKVELARLPGAHAAFLQTLRSFLALGGFKPEHVRELHAALPRITAPTLVLWGREDRFVSARHADVLRRLMPAVQVQTWERCGHVPQIEYPQRFNRTALQFWSGLETRA